MDLSREECSLREPSAKWVANVKSTPLAALFCIGSARHSLSAQEGGVNNDDQNISFDYRALGVIHGAAFIIAPYEVAAFYGLEQSLAVALVSRLFGAALVAWGAILWSARGFRDEAAARAVLISTCVAEAISLCFIVQGTLAGTINSMGWVAVLIYLFGAVGCGYFLMGQKRLAAV